MALQSKLLVYAAIVGLLGLMGVIFWYGNLDAPEIEQVEIEIIDAEVSSINKVENTSKLTVTFLVKNPSETTFTVSVIGYQLYADGELLGSGQYSTADVAMPGRAIFSSGAEIPLKNIFELSLSDVDNKIYQAVLDGEINSFRAEGVITVESAWSTIEKDFDSHDHRRVEAVS
jgi:LEA14-like dessication related protein